MKLVKIKSIRNQSTLPPPPPPPPPPAGGGGGGGGAMILSTPVMVPKPPSIPAWVILVVSSAVFPN